MRPLRSLIEALNRINNTLIERNILLADNNQALTDLKAVAADVATSMTNAATALTDLASKAKAGQDISGDVETLVAQFSAGAAALNATVAQTDPAQPAAPAA